MFNLLLLFTQYLHYYTSVIVSNVNIFKLQSYILVMYFVNTIYINVHFESLHTIKQNKQQRTSVHSKSNNCIFKEMGWVFLDKWVRYITLPSGHSGLRPPSGHCINQCNWTQSIKWLSTEKKSRIYRLWRILYNYTLLLKLESM